MAVRSLAEGRTKFTILTTAPANPAAPTVTELAAGIDASCKIARSGFRFTMVASDTVDDPELCATGKSVAPGPDNADISFTGFRYWLAAGGVDPAADTLFAAVKTKGTVLYAYARSTDDLATTAWAAADPIYLGAKFWVDWPEFDDTTGGWKKWTTRGYAEQTWPNITAAAGA